MAVVADMAVGPGPDRNDRNDRPDRYLNVRKTSYNACVQAVIPNPRVR
jgi:hypothetical protein